VADAISTLIPGVYPHIVNRKPKLGGLRNLGVGVDSAGVEYVLKPGAVVGVAEFVGAGICRELGVPHCLPAIVTWTPLVGGPVHLFGSVIEPAVLKFDQKLVLEWQRVVAEMVNPQTFTEVLAVDLCVGNDDRHAGNWIVREKDPSAGRAHHQLLAMDFGDSWPCVHPPHPPTKHPSRNTWDIPRHWPAMGITFDHDLFRRTCTKISSLQSSWLRSELDVLIGVWLTPAQRDDLCDWWRDHWPRQVIDVIFSLENDGDWL
jgi:hypothetical protein